MDQNIELMLQDDRHQNNNCTIDCGCAIGGFVFALTGLAIAKFGERSSGATTAGLTMTGIGMLTIFAPDLVELSRRAIAYIRSCCSANINNAENNIDQPILHGDAEMI